MITTDTGQTLDVTDTGCMGEIVWTEDGTCWERVQDGEWWDPEGERTGRTR